MAYTISSYLFDRYTAPQVSGLLLGGFIDRNNLSCIALSGIGLVNGAGLHVGGPRVMSNAELYSFVSDYREARSTHASGLIQGLVDSLAIKQLRQDAIASYTGIPSGTLQFSADETALLTRLQGML